MPTEFAALDDRIHMDRLVNRRDRIMARIRTLNSQLKQLEHNAFAYAEDSQNQRRNLLTYLSSFHHTEVDQVDSALNRLATGKYGLCLACKGQIEVAWLESFPEAEFCSSCYRMRERVAAG